jgi:transposase-like protein
MKPNNIKEKKYKKLCCPSCKSKNIKKNGRRKTQNRGLIQRYKCKDCEYRFTNDDGFLRMRNHPKKITCAIDLFYRGVSTRKVQEHFQAFYPENSSHKSIYKWIIKYSKIISKFTDNLKLQVGRELQVDEMEYHRRKHHNKKGVDKNWFIDAVDCKTRFMVSSEYTKARGKNELKLVIKKAKDKTGEQVKICTTDGLLAYGNIVKKNWGYNNKLGKYMVEHNVVNASKGEGFNIMIERLHNSIRERTKTMRGFHGSVESANAIMKGLEIYYNFIRKHQAIRKYPYELACPELKLESNNKWLELIQLSKIKST